MGDLWGSPPLFQAGAPKMGFVGLELLSPAAIFPAKEAVC